MSAADSKLLRDVVEDPGLPADHVLKRAANLGLYLISTRGTSHVERLQFLRAAKIDGTPCGLVVLRSVKPPASKFYPQEAALWNLEGWTHTSLNLDGRGKVTSIDPVYAYPPLIFGKAARRVSDNLKFDLRRDPKLQGGCTGLYRVIQFKLKS